MGERLRPGRLSLGKGHFSSPATCLVDAIKISEPPRNSDKSFLHEKYVVEGLSEKSLADLLGCHQETSHKSELLVIETIKRMYREEHLRPRSIASLLDTMKVPTKRRGKKWDHSVASCCGFR